MVLHMRALMGNGFVWVRGGQRWERPKVLLAWLLANPGNPPGAEDVLIPAGTVERAEKGVRWTQVSDSKACLVGVKYTRDSSRLELAQVTAQRQ